MIYNGKTKRVDGAHGTDLPAKKTAVHQFLMPNTVRQRSSLPAPRTAETIRLPVW